MMLKKIIIAIIIFILSIISVVINLSNLNQKDLIFNFDFSIFFIILFVNISIILFYYIFFKYFHNNIIKKFSNFLFKYSLTFIPLLIMYGSLTKFYFSPQSSNPPQLFTLVIGLSLFSGLQLFFWLTLLKNYLKNIYQFINQNIIFLFILFLFIYFILNFIGSYVSFLSPKYINFDTWLHLNAIYNTANGEIGISKILGETFNHSLFAVHSYFIIFLFSFFYKLYSDPITIYILIQAAHIISTFLLFKITKYYLNNSIASFFIASAYLLNFCIQNMGYLSFRVFFISPLFIIMMFYAFTFNKKTLFIISFILLALCKESSFIFLFFFCISLYLLSFKKKYIILSIISVLILILWMFVIQPKLSHVYYDLNMHYNVEGTTSFFSQIFVMFTNALTVRRIAYFFLLYLPSGFIAFFSPTLFISTLSDIVYTITAYKGYMSNIYWGYQLNLSAMIYISSIFGILNLCKLKIFHNYKT